MGKRKQRRHVYFANLIKSLDVCPRVGYNVHFIGSLGGRKGGLLAKSKRTSTGRECVGQTVALLLQRD